MKTEPLQIVLLLLLLVLLVLLVVLLLFRKGVHDMGVYVHRASRCNVSPWDSLNWASACALTPTPTLHHAPASSVKLCEEILNSSTRGID